MKSKSIKKGLTETAESIAKDVKNLSSEVIPSLSSVVQKNFALIGAAGYIAPRHLEAIYKTGHKLVAATDPHDSVGILDRYFPETRFFTEFERFDRYAEKLRRGNSNERIDYVSICSPNYLHDAHIRFALRIGANAICEKPLVLKPWNLDVLRELEDETGKNVNVILQLRLHPALIELKKQLQQDRSGKKREIVLSYITPRGPWYLYSWKGHEARSGGLSTNIGIHLFDMLLWLFGSVEKAELHVNDETKCSGFLELEYARVRWFLSIDKGDLPETAKTSGVPSFRSMTMDGQEIEFSDGFTELHTKIYQETLVGRGFSIEDARPSLELVHLLRKTEKSYKSSNLHPLVKGQDAVFQSKETFSAQQL